MSALPLPQVAPDRTTLPSPATAPRNAKLVLAVLWLAIYFAALFAPPLLDDADATHASAARAMLTTGDWVTLHVDGIRYLEKAPLPYWLVAICFRIFGFNTFAAHLPSALAVLALTALAWRWGTRAFNQRTAYYAALATLTSVGVFLFTRIFIPEILLSLFLALALYSFLRSLEISTTSSTHEGRHPERSAAQSKDLRVHQQESVGTSTNPGGPSFRALSERVGSYHPYILWASLALAVLTKGLVALVFFFGTALIYLLLTKEYRNWRALKPFTGLLLFLAIAAPWHILAGIRNTQGANGHGFFWFYFVNEHFLRFLGKRTPVDYNKLPGYLFWSLHLVWLFPWSLLLPLPIIAAVRRWKNRRSIIENFSHRTTVLLTIFSALVLIFFSLSTNQEYYTFPAYLPILLLITAALTRSETNPDGTTQCWITAAHATLTILGLAVAAALAYGLWSARHLPFVPDIGDLLAHRGVGDYTLSMSHFFDLTGESFAALRLPASLALIAFLIGPAAAWRLRNKQKDIAATTTIALTAALFCIAAHIALCRFAPMLSSHDMAEKIGELEDDRLIDRGTDIYIFGDQSFGSSIPFYTGDTVLLVNGRSTSLLFGSTFPDAPRIFVDSQQFASEWGTGERRLIFVPLEKRDDFDKLALPHQTLIEETSGKALITDRPLDRR